MSWLHSKCIHPTVSLKFSLSAGGCWGADRHLISLHFQNLQTGWTLKRLWSFASTFLKTEESESDVSHRVRRVRAPTPHCTLPSLKLRQLTSARLRHDKPRSHRAGDQLSPKWQATAESIHLEDEGNGGRVRSPNTRGPRSGCLSAAEIGLALS